MREVTVAAVQMSCAREREANIEAAGERVRKAATLGADIVLLPELFAGPYFCKDQDPAHFERALPRAGHPMLRTMSDLARELGVVLPVSFFERAGNAYFNSLVMIDADGTELGLYRKSHIPDGPGYQEKYYFSPGDTGFRVRFAQGGSTLTQQLVRGYFLQHRTSVEAGKSLFHTGFMARLLSAALGVPALVGAFLLWTMIRKPA